MIKKACNSRSKSIKKEEKPCLLYDYIADIPGYIYIKDCNSAYLAANKLFLKIAGLKSMSELVGKTDHDLPWKERYNEYRKNDSYVIETGKSVICEQTIKISGDDTRIFVTEKKPLKDSAGNIVGVMCNSLDITEDKKITAIHTNKEITEKTIKFMEMLARNIAHELRTPLSIIKLNVDLLEHSYSSNDIGQSEKEIILSKTLGLIKQVIKANTYVLENILVTLKNLVSGKIDNQQFTRISINENIEDTLGHFPFQEHERSLVYWHKSQGFEYLGDDLLTRHVLFGLLQNALRAIKDAGKGRITILLKKNRDYNQLIFKDTALGIPDGYLCKIFERFESNEPSKTGSGLGLSFCKMIMNAYGGDIACNSQEGKFTEFVLSFPKIK